MPVAKQIYYDLFNVIKTLPENYTAQVLDYVSYLKAKAEREADSTSDCPICAKCRDPITGIPLYNTETRAAIAEGDAILRGEIPAKWYNSLDEMIKDLDADDDEDD